MKIFISYSHKDEWLKNELLSAMSGVRRKGEAVIWHDRMLKPGQNLANTISAELDGSDVVVLLLSPDFFDSNYCFDVEFARAKQLHLDGKLHLVPIVVRKCDWDVDIFPNIVLLPTDAKPVNPPTARPEDRVLRDESWHDVVQGLKKIITKTEEGNIVVEIKSRPVEIKQNHLDLRARKLQINHPKVTSADILDILVGPPLSGSVDGDEIASLDDLIRLSQEDGAVLLAGDDLHGKTAILFALQQRLCDIGIPAIIINGRDIRNKDLVTLVEKEMPRQLVGEGLQKSNLVLLIDDVDECKLPDYLLRSAIANAGEEFHNVVATAYSPLFGALFEAMGTGLTVVSVGELNSSQIYEITERWLFLGEDETEQQRLEPQVRHVFKMVSGIVKGGSAGAGAGMILNLLRLFDSTQGADVSLTSNAACYDALTSTQLLKAGISNSRIDLAKNFAGFLAIEVWGRADSYTIDRKLFAAVKKRVEDLYFEELKDVEGALIGAKIISVTDEGYEFASKTMVFFFAGRHLAKHVKDRDPALYELCIDDCVENIKIRSHANTILYCLYFNSDLSVFSRLIEKMDRQFGDVKHWKLDRAADALMGVDQQAVELVQSSESHRDQRLAVMGEKFRDVVKRDTGLAEHYLSPFSEVSVGLEEHVEADDASNEAAVEYLSEMNTLFRLQSVLTSGLKTRSGTFERDTIIRTVDSMVRAAGRFSHLNIFLAGQMLVDSERTLKGIERGAEKDFAEIESGVETEMYARERNRILLERFDSMVGFFTRWSMVLTQGVLGRFLADGGSIKALELLHSQEERLESGSVSSDRQYNYVAALAVAKLWKTGKIDTKFYDELISAYGKNSRLFDVLRMSMFVFSRHMPLDLEVRQWLDRQMHIKIGQTRMKQRGIKPVPKLTKA